MKMNKNRDDRRGKERRRIGDGVSKDQRREERKEMTERGMKIDEDEDDTRGERRTKRGLKASQRME